MLSQERVGPCPNLGVVPEQQVPSGGEGQELGPANMRGGVLGHADGVDPVIRGVDDERGCVDLLQEVAGAWIDRGSLIANPVDSPGDRLKRIDHA